MGLLGDCDGEEGGETGSNEANATRDENGQWGKKREGEKGRINVRSVN